MYNRESSLPLLVDDGTDAHLHEGGTLEAINGSDDQLSGAARSCVRGVRDETDDVVVGSHYDVYGEVRASGGVSTLFRYTGEQLDGETGFTYLRSRYLNSPLARFTSADTVQPNAPGTRGYNLYAYVANNPTTWIDPSGHTPQLAFEGAGGSGGSLATASSFAIQGRRLIGVLAQTPNFMRMVYGACKGNTACSVAVFTGITAPMLVCAFTPHCFGDALVDADLIGKLGSKAKSTMDWDIPWLRRAPWWWPLIPAAPLVQDAADNIDFSSPGGGGDDCLSFSDVVSLLADIVLAGPVGNEGLGRASSATAEQIGNAWVGDNWRWSGDGTTKVSIEPDGTEGKRIYRPAAFKTNEGVTRANLEYRASGLGGPIGEPDSNYHIDIDESCP